MIKNTLMKIKHTIQLIAYNIKVSRCFIKETESNTDEDREDYIISVAAHTIEKGLGCINYKPGWGTEKAERLLNLLIHYVEKGYSQERFGFTDGYAVVAAYIEHKKSVGENIDRIEDLYHKLSEQIICDKQSCLAGKEIISKEKLYVDESASRNLLNTCRSVRNYSEKEVSEEDILEAIELANQAPSACNRQPVRCYYTLDKNKVAQCDALIPGNAPIKGETPNFIVVTTSRQYFGLYEYDQWYVNGGIFLGYLRLALQTKGIGNCIYQWTINAEEEKLRKIYNIPTAEVIIAIVGIGYFPDEAHCIYAQRKKIEEIAIKVD